MRRPSWAFFSACGLVLLGFGRPAAAQPSFSDCGVLVQGVTCVLFEIDTGEQYLLDDYGTFVVGDEVLVIGDLDPGCITICNQGNGCIFNNTIETCVMTLPVFLRGDANQDGGFDIADPVTILDRLFGGGAPTECGDADDANDDGMVDISDPISVLANLFGAGPPPPPPFPFCGTDPTADALTCEAFAGCP